MHPTIYREFHIGLAPEVETRELARGVKHDEPVLFVMLRRLATGQEAVFKLVGDAGTPERWIEEQVMRQFPETESAAELRKLYGRSHHTFKAGWERSFGERLYAGLKHCPDTKGLRYWQTLIPALPPVLYAAMTARAVTHLSDLGDRMQLKDAVKALHDAWTTVLKEARLVSLTMTGMQRLALDLAGWHTEHLRGLSMLEFAQFKEKALFASLALEFLDDSDWSAMLLPMMDAADAPAAEAQHAKEAS